MNTFEKYKEFMITEFLDAVRPPAMGSGRGATLTGEDGREYIDCFAGISVVNAGHCNPEIVAAARAQMDKLIHCGTYLHPHAPAADLAELLAEITPGRLRKSFFGNSGAEVNEAAMRLAKQFTGKTEFLALHGAFHGRTLATLSVSGMANRKQRGGPYMSGVAFVPAPYCYRCPFGLTADKCGLACAQEIENVLRAGTSRNVAALFIEPVQGEGGVIVPPAGYFSAVKEILNRHGILLIVDEVQTGFCRTGRMFAIEHEGIEPDIMTMGKGIAGGFPLGAMITRPEIAGAFKPGDLLSTFGGNPVCCAAAIAAIGFYRREKIAERATTAGEKFMTALRLKTRDNPRVGEVRGRGLMVGVELIKNDEKDPAPELAKAVQESCRKNGLIIGVGGVLGNVLRIQPPLVISDEQLAKAAEIIVNACRNC